MRYQPKRSSARWLEGAPRPVLACYDNGGKSCDRYTVLYGAPDWTPEMGVELPARAMSESPFSPQGFGMYVTCLAHNRAALGKKIKFQDLPPDCRRLVIRDCETD